MGSKNVSIAQSGQISILDRAVSYRHMNYTFVFPLPPPFKTVQDNAHQKKVHLKKVLAVLLSLFRMTTDTFKIMVQLTGMYATTFCNISLSRLDRLRLTTILLRNVIENNGFPKRKYFYGK